MVIYLYFLVTMLSVVGGRHTSALAKKTVYYLLKPVIEAGLCDRQWLRERDRYLRSPSSNSLMVDGQSQSLEQG